MKQILLGLAAAAFALALGAPSAMADAIGGAKEPIDWSGPNWGISGGKGWGQSEVHSPLTSTGDFDLSGGALGVTAGYKWQIDNFVLGIDSDISLTTIEGTTTNACAGCTTKLEWLGTLRGTAGYSMGKFMPYVTGGLAVGRVNTSITGLDSVETKAGWTAGGGLAYGLTTGFSIKAEYLYTDLGNVDFVAGSSIVTKADNFQIARIGLTFGF